MESIEGVVQEEIVISEVAPEKVSVLLDLEEYLSDDGFVLDRIPLTHYDVILEDVSVHLHPEVVGIDLKLLLHL